MLPNHYLHIHIIVERPLHSLERVLAVQKPDSYLCIKPNTFADKLLPFVSVYNNVFTLHFCFLYM